MSLADALAGALAKGKVKSDENKDLGLFLSTGVPNIDYALSGSYRGGGYKSSRVHEIAGPPSAGKTQIATSVMIEAQRAGGAAAFHDHERTFAENLAVSFGLNNAAGIFTYKRPRTFEESIDQAVDWMEAIRKADVIPFEAPLALVFDSFAAMVPAEKMERGSDAANMREKVALATAASQELPAFCNFVEENNACVLFLNQIRTKPGVVYGDPRYTPGGDSLPFYSSTRAFLSRSMVKDKKTKEVEGQNITMEVIKNKTHRPFEKTGWSFRFKPDGTGYIDIVDSMIDHLVDIGGFEKQGDYLVWDGKKYFRTQITQVVSQRPDAIDVLIAMAEKVQAQRVAA